MFLGIGMIGFCEMQIKLIAPKTSWTKLQIAAILSLCELEGIEVIIINNPSERLFKDYYKGSNPAILVYQDSQLEAFMYGYWDFVGYVQKNKMLYC